MNNPNQENVKPSIQTHVGNDLTNRQKQILACIEQAMNERGYPPSVREIALAVGLTSPSTVHTHLATLQKMGYLRRDPTKPRAIEIRYDAQTGTHGQRRPYHHIPLIGDVAAGTDVLAQENIEDMYPLPTDFTGTGELYMLRVRGDSMIEAGIFEGDYLVIRVQKTANNGEIIVAGIPGDEATVKKFYQEGNEITLQPANIAYAPMKFQSDEVQIYGKVVTVLRSL